MYLDNIAFREALIAKDMVTLTPMFIVLCDNIANNWCRGKDEYYRDDMKQEMFIKCLELVHKYDADKNTSAFAYFTTCLVNVFRLGRSKETTEIKKQYKLFEHLYGSVPDSGKDE